MSLPSASQIARAILCPGSEGLPHADTISDAGEGGAAIHAYLADPTHLLALVPEMYRDACESIELDKLPKGEWASEVAFAWNHETDEARELGRNLKRRYPQTLDSEYVGTADLVGLTADEVVILDWKSGRSRLPQPSENWQLRALALFAARAYGRQSARVGIVRTWSPERFQTAAFDALDLAGFAAELHEMPDRWAAGGGLVQGDHCGYCPAFEHCPAKLALWATAGIQGPSITPENAQAVYIRAEAVAQILGRVRAGLAMYAKEHPISLPDGMVYGPVVKSTEHVDPFVVQAELTKLHGAKVAELALDMETSKAAIDRAIATIAPKWQKAKLVREAVDAVRAAGGVTVTTKESIAEHKEQHAIEDAAE